MVFSCSNNHLPKIKPHVQNQVMDYMKNLMWCALAILSSCGLAQPEIPGFNAAQWSLDKNGCEGLRQEAASNLFEHKDLLLGYSQNDIKYFLGKPDEQELYNRSQTFFHYYISGHTECESDENSPVIVQIRFNALNSSNEVYFTNYQPEYQ